jgi:hypothetical protein
MCATYPHEDLMPSTTRETCFFCDAQWGKCHCPDLPDDAGFEHEDFIVNQPNVDESGRFFVDPVAHYGEAFTKWREAAGKQINKLWRDHRWMGEEHPEQPWSDADKQYVRTASRYLEPEERLVVYGAYKRVGWNWIEPPVFGKAIFGFEGGEFGPIIEGYDNGGTWNGWRTPLVTRATLETFVKEFNAGAKEDNVNCPFREIRGDVVFAKYADDDDFKEEIKPEEAVTVDGKLTLWDIGAGLTWDILTENDVKLARERIAKEKK